MGASAPNHRAPINAPLSAALQIGDLTRVHKDKRQLKHLPAKPVRHVLMQLGLLKGSAAMAIVRHAKAALSGQRVVVRRIGDQKAAALPLPRRVQIREVAGRSIPTIRLRFWRL